MIHVNQAPQPNTMVPFFRCCNIRPSLRRSVDSNVVSKIIAHNFCKEATSIAIHKWEPFGSGDDMFFLLYQKLKSKKVTKVTFLFMRGFIRFQVSSSFADSFVSGGAWCSTAATR